jgi:hypothetical protein
MNIPQADFVTTAESHRGPDLMRLASVSFPNRRSFLKTTIAAAAWLFLPRFLLARSNRRSFWFLHTSTGESWPVDDPVAWSLKNARQPILERARERLVTLDAADPQRVIRLVVGRCHLSLGGAI